MPKYNETSVVGESWKRAFQILIENFYGRIPKIRFSEEEIFVNSEGRAVGMYNGEGIEEYFTNENALTRFQLKNPQTEEYIDQYATYQDLYVLIHSLYFHLAKIRDQGSPPHPFWSYNEETKSWEAPIPMPDDGKEYSWNEDTQTWEEALPPPPPRPYPSWVLNPTTNQWEAPVPMPNDGQEYIWDENTQTWNLVVN